MEGAGGTYARLARPIGAEDRKERGNQVDAMRSQRQRLLCEAEGYLELAMFDHALVTLGQLGDAADLKGHAAYLRGESLRALERYPEAIVALQRASESMSDDIHVLLALAWCYKRNDQINKAIASLDEAELIEPDDALVQYNLACYWSLRGDKYHALRYLAIALAAQSDYRDLIDDESDFDSIRNDPDFLELTSVIV